MAPVCPWRRRPRAPVRTARGELLFSTVHGDDCLMWSKPAKGSTTPLWHIHGDEGDELQVLVHDSSSCSGSSGGGAVGETRSSTNNVPATKWIDGPDSRTLDDEGEYEDWAHSKAQDSARHASYDKDRRANSNKATPGLLRTQPRRRRFNSPAGFLSTLQLTAIAIGLCLAALGAYWVVWFATLRQDAYSHSIFAKPLEPRGHDVESLVEPFAGVSALDDIQSELQNRFTRLNAPPSTLACDTSPDTLRRYQDLAQDGPYLFALNLWNNQQVLPTIARSLIDLAPVLGPANMHVSVFENGSMDNTTMALAHFAAALTAAGVPHTILSDPRPTDWATVDRIAQLALYRNYVLRPLNESPADAGTGKPFKHVVFINDVFTCPTDVLELVWQRNDQQAHAACAMDWRATQSPLQKLGRKKGVKFYDNWVARDLNGNMLRARLDVFAEVRDGIKELFDQPGAEPFRERFIHGLPTPVYSCWNGMLALPAAPFQAGGDKPAIEFRSAFNHPGQCAASECKILARDFWARGLNRWLVVPSVHVTYDRESYDYPGLVQLAQKSQSPPAHLSPRIDWSAYTTPKSVMCWAWARVRPIDFPWRSTRTAPFR